MTENEMVGWHHQLNGHEFEQAPGDGKGQGSLASCSPWGHKEQDTTEQLNNNIVNDFWKEITNLMLKLKLQYFVWLPDVKSQLIRKDFDAGKD